MERAIAEMDNQMRRQSRERGVVGASTIAGTEYHNSNENEDAINIMDEIDESVKHYEGPILSKKNTFSLEKLTRSSPVAQSMMTNKNYGGHNISHGGSSGGGVNMTKQSIDMRSSNGAMASILRNAAAGAQIDSFLLRSQSPSSPVIHQTKLLKSGRKAS